MRGIIIIIIQLIVGFFLPPTITDADASVGWRVQNCRVICKNVVAAPMLIAQDREVIMGCVLKLIWHKKINHSAGCDRRSIKADVTSCTYPWYHLPRKSKEMTIISAEKKKENRRTSPRPPKKDREYEKHAKDKRR